MISGAFIGEVPISSPDSDPFVPGPKVISPASLVESQLFGTALLVIFDITVFEHDYTLAPRKTTWSIR